MDLPNDFEDLLVKYVRADLLEGWMEFGKASKIWEQYMEEFYALETRVKNFNNADLLRAVGHV